MTSSKFDPIASPIADAEGVPEVFAEAFKAPEGEKPPREPDRHLQPGLRMVGRGAATTAEQDGTLPREATNPSGRAELLPRARRDRVGQMPARKTALSQAA